jgi:hypothetical protein
MRRGLQPKKGLYSGANRTSLPPPYHDGCGWVGSSTSLITVGPPRDLTRYDLPRQSHPGALQYRAGILNQALGRLCRLKAWRDKT